MSYFENHGWKAPPQKRDYSEFWHGQGLEELENDLEFYGSCPEYAEIYAYMDRMALHDVESYKRGERPLNPL